MHTNCSSSRLLMYFMALQSVPNTSLHFHLSICIHFTSNLYVFTFDIESRVAVVRGLKVPDVSVVRMSVSQT